MAENNPDDFYADAEIPSSETPVEEPAAEEQPKAENGDQTALLPKAIFMGKDLEPGKRCEVEVVRVHDGEVEVKYIPHGAKKTEPTDSDPEFASMME